jgi:ribosomal-protein-alanine N-acetyltransferase
MVVNIKKNKLKIRPMTVNDLEQVKAIDDLSFSLPWPESAYRYEIGDNPASLLWVAELETIDGLKQICGMVVVWLILDETHIATLAVHPDCRGIGVGKCLLNTALKESAKRGANNAHLEVRKSNQVAIEMYQGFGFEIVGRRAKYYKDNHEDAILMTLDNLKELLEISMMMSWINYLEVIGDR